MIANLILNVELSVHIFFSSKKSGCLRLMKIQNSYLVKELVGGSCEQDN